MKHKVTALLKHGWIVLDDVKVRPNINNNLLPTHESKGSVNVLEKGEKELEKVLDLGKLEVPIKDLLRVLIEVKQVKLELLIIQWANGVISEYHPNETKKPNDFMKEIKQLVALQTVAFEREVTSKPNST